MDDHLWRVAHAQICKVCRDNGEKFCDYNSESDRKCENCNKQKPLEGKAPDHHFLFLPKASQHGDEKEVAALAEKAKLARDTGNVFEPNGQLSKFIEKVADVELRFAYKVEPLAFRDQDLRLGKDQGAGAKKAYQNVIKHQDLSFLERTKASALTAVGSKKQRAKLTHAKLFRAVKKIALGSRVLRATNRSPVPERQIFAIGRVRPAKLHANASDGALSQLHGILRLDEGKNRFEAIDVDQSGSLSLQELTQFCKSVGLSMPQNALRIAFQEMDFDGNGSISMAEFQTYLDTKFSARKGELLNQHNREIRTRGDDLLYGRGFCIFQTRREAYDAKLRFEKKPFIIKETPISRLQRIFAKGNHHEIFFQIDVDRSGKLSVDEWHRFCVQHDVALQKQDLQMMVNGMDRNKDGEIDVDEFQAGLKKLPPRVSGPDYRWLPLDDETGLECEVLPKDEDA